MTDVNLVSLLPRDYNDNHFEDTPGRGREKYYDAL